MVARGSELISGAFWKLSNSFAKSLIGSKSVPLTSVTMQSLWLWSLLRWLLCILHQYNMLFRAKGGYWKQGRPCLRSWCWKASKIFPNAWAETRCGFSAVRMNPTFTGLLVLLKGGWEQWLMMPGQGCFSLNPYIHQLSSVLETLAVRSLVITWDLVSLVLCCIDRWLSGLFPFRNRCKPQSTGMQGRQIFNDSTFSVCCKAVVLNVWAVQGHIKAIFNCWPDVPVSRCRQPAVVTRRRGIKTILNRQQTSSSLGTVLKIFFPLGSLLPWSQRTRQKLKESYILLGEKY